MLAIPWHIINLEGGKLSNAIMVGAVTLASLFWGIYAGTLIDKYNRKYIFLTLTGIDFCIVGGVALWGMINGQVPFPLIVLVYTATIFTYNVHYPNLYAFVQELFEPALYSRVNSAIEIQGQTTNFLGMMIGGILIDGSPGVDWWPDFLQFEAWPLQHIFLMDSLTYILGFMLISQIPYVRGKDWKADIGNVWGRIRTGFDYLNTHRSLFVFGLASYVIFFSLLVVVQVVAPIYVKDYLVENATVLSFFKGFYAVGAITAGLIGLSLWVRRTNLIRQIIFLLLVAAGLYFTLALTHSVLITLFAGILLGICNAGTRILRITYIVRIVPNEVIGRVNSFFAVINVLMRVSFFGIMALPFFANDGNGGNVIYAAMILGAIMMIAAVVLIVRFNSFDEAAARE